MSMRKRIGLAATILALWLAVAFLPSVLHVIGHPQPVAKLASWGEAFGSVTALFTAAGFFAIYLTFRSQQKQIEDASRDQHRQQFDKSFFRLLSLLREAREEVRFRYSEEFAEAHRRRRKSFWGVAAFHLAWRETSYWIEEENPRTRERLATLYEVRVHDRFESRLSIYFRLLYTILKRIQMDAVLSQDEKDQYAKLLRSQLSSYEVALAALNGLTVFSNDMSELLVEFRMLKYVPNDERRDLLERYYPAQAFQARD